jgi:hypothetical protein
LWLQGQETGGCQINEVHGRQVAEGVFEAEWIKVRFKQCSTRRSEASDDSGRFNKTFHVERFIERTSE